MLTKHYADRNENKSRHSHPHCDSMSGWTQSAVGRKTHCIFAWDFPHCGVTLVSEHNRLVSPAMSNGVDRAFAVWCTRRPPAPFFVIQPPAIPGVMRRKCFKRRFEPYSVALPEPSFAVKRVVCQQTPTSFANARCSKTQGAIPSPLFCSRDAAASRRRKRSLPEPILLIPFLVAHNIAIPNNLAASQPLAMTRLRPQTGR